MKKSFSSKEKAVLTVTFLLIVAAVISRAVMGANDTGVLIVLGFLNIFIYILCTACALFPADYRMTERQKEKIKDMDRYKAKYKIIVVAGTAVFCLVLDGVILFFA